jgi:hypothetical protein
MPNSGYSQTPRLLKGALIYFSAPLLIPVPNIIVFQYNPESMARSLNPWQPAVPPKIELKEGENLADNPAFKERVQQLVSLAQPYDPAETFSLALELDATDALEADNAVAKLTGVADRLAAIEMLMYPPGDSVLGDLAASASAALSGGISVGGFNAYGAVMRKEVPVVLFFWGPGRIVPVRITSLSIEEQQFSPQLYPLRAKATIGVRVLHPDDLVMADGNAETSAAVTLAKGCYLWTRGQKEALALVNLRHSPELAGSIVRMLPI